jgi:hypothetical protein
MNAVRVLPLYMSFRSFLLACVSLTTLVAADDRLLHIRNIYILSMTGGLDQYLGSRLTQSGKFIIVTDPSHADAVLTDQIGSVFEDRFLALYPPPAPPPQEEPATSGHDKEAAAPVEEKSMVAMLGAASSGGHVSSFSRGRGNLFLVSRDTKQVIWSTYLRPKNTRPDEMDHTADKIVDRIEEALSHQQKEAKKLAKMEQQNLNSEQPAPMPVIAAPPPQQPVAPASAPAPSPAPTQPASGAAAPAVATPPASAPAPSTPATVTSPAQAPATAPAPSAPAPVTSPAKAPAAPPAATPPPAQPPKPGL